ncbi:MULTISPECIES: archaeosortase C [unclassified Archaeoglobus]|uniref:archaeosortase C n=1 Tax=unclassified Archaeoglobus TaxID=2643606 RepID=UPI0025C2BA60|nr:MULTISPECIES: archaeosortase C [unclassified Archaeoglobus]
MTQKREGLTLALAALLLIAAFIELSYGSLYIGLIFLILIVVFIYILTRKSERDRIRPSKLQIFVGATLILLVVGYNLYKNSEIQTLDSMVLLLGFSLIVSNIPRFSEIGKFSVYFSFLFLVFYSILFLIPENVGFDLPYYYGHYFVTLPVVATMQNMGYNLSNPDMRLIEVCGVERTVLKIDLACFGWYSLILIISLVIAYSETVEKFRTKKLLIVLALLILASYIANLLRVAILVHLTYFYGVKTMMTVHSHLGWILFAVFLLPVAFFLLKKNQVS